MTSYTDFSRDTAHYSLANNFSLQKADTDTYRKYWAVYRNVQEDFTLDFATRANDLADLPFGFWILRGEQRIGGCVMFPNMIGDLFLIPPFTDFYAAMSAVLPLLHHWSDASKPISADPILPTQRAAFQRLGFRVQEARHWMIRPLEKFDVAFPDTYQVDGITHEQAPALATLFVDGFQGGVGQYGRRDVEEQRGSIDNYFETIASDDPCYLASKVMFHDGKIIAVCLVQMHNGLPSIRFVVTHPAHQRKGLGTALMHLAMTQLAPIHNYMTLAVSVENPAHAQYYNMGFQPAEITYQMQYPART